jgi:hypothetical protein
MLAPKRVPTLDRAEDRMRVNVIGKRAAVVKDQAL